MCKIMVIGVGAAGNKAVLNVIEKEIVSIGDTLMINSTKDDFPKGYEGKKILLNRNDSGAGKQRDISFGYFKTSLANGDLIKGTDNDGFDLTDKLSHYETIILISSTEGGTGSGVTPVLANYIMSCKAKTPHIIAITGFEDDINGMANTVDFFKEVPEECVLETVSNKAFLDERGNKFKAQKAANDEIAERIRIMRRLDFISGDQNIDSMDILNLNNSFGYTTIEKAYIPNGKSLVDKDSYNKFILGMINRSKSIPSSNPASVFIGVIWNLKDVSEDAIDGDHKILIETYGRPVKFFEQKQWDENQEYIAFIVSGMKKPLDEVEAIYSRYLEGSGERDNNKDSFREKLSGCIRLDIDKSYDAKVSAPKVIGTDEFLKTLK